MGKRDLQVSLKTLAFCAITEPNPDSGMSILHQACIMGDLETVRLVLDFSPSKLDNAVALCLRVRENAQQFAGYNAQGIAQSLQTTEHERIADFLHNEKKSFQRRSLIREIASKGNKAQLKRLMLYQTNSDWSDMVKNKTDCSGTTLLMSACSNNNSDMAEFLISQGARVHARNKSHRTALHLAAYSNSTAEVIEVLLKNGADIDDDDVDGLTALHHAAENGHYETVVHLIEKGCNLVKKTSICPSTSIPESSPRFNRSAGMTPLHFAAQNGHSNIVELLITKGVDVDCKTTRGWTSLMLASQGGHLETVRLLLHLGSEVEELDISNNSVLQYAAQKCHLDIAQILIDNGADIGRHVHKKDMEKLLILAAKKRNPKLLKALLLKGYYSNLSSSNYCDGGTLLHEAASISGNVDVVQTLLNQGADIQARDKHGMTALHHAADIETAALLLSVGCDLNATDKSGEVAAFHAARSNRWKVVQYFVQQGCEMSSLSAYGFSLLQLLVTARCPLSQILCQRPFHF